MFEEFCYDHPMVVFISTVMLAIALIVGCVCTPAYYAADHACAKRAEMLETEYKYGFWQGCWVKAEGKWVEYGTMNNVRFTDDRATRQ